MSANPDLVDPVMNPPVWSLAWREDGELAPQDHVDVLQTLIATESLEVQNGLIASLERLWVADFNLVVSQEVTGLCA